MADKPFRVLLDLTELHIECLKYVWMSVSPQDLKTIADFKTSVIRKIKLDNVIIKLFVRNGLLLDNETVMVLREDDTVKVCYVDDQSGCSRTDFKLSKKSSRKRNHTEDVWDSSTNTKQCKRSRTLTEEKEAFQSVEIYSKKKKKHRNSAPSSENLYSPPKTNEDESNNDKQATSNKNKTDFNSLRKSDLFFSYINQDSTEENNSKEFETDKIADTDSYLNLNSVNDSLSANVSPTEYSLKESFDINSETIKSSEGLNNNCSKKKRKRRKKRKQGLESTTDVNSSTEINKEFKSFTNESENSIQRKQSENNIQRKHIIYQPSTFKKEDIQLEYGNKNEDVKEVVTDTFTFEEGVSNASVKPNNYPKVSTPAQSDFCKNPKWCSSLMQHTDLNFNQNETVGFKEKYKKYSYRNYADQRSVPFDISQNNENSTELDYANLPALNSRPDIGTHIAYKILELDEHYSPVISGYREGIVKSIDPNNEEMEIELLKHEIKPGRTGKFENLKQDEVPLPEIKTCDNVRWSTLVEPKIIARQ